MFDFNCWRGRLLYSCFLSHHVLLCPYTSVRGQCQVKSNFICIAHLKELTKVQNKLKIAKIVMKSKCQAQPELKGSEKRRVFSNDFKVSRV